MTGLPYQVRLAGSGLRALKTAIPGTDMAGVVEAVGSDVIGFRPGDEVFGSGKGAYAEYARAPETKLAPKPANLSFEQAAAVAHSASTALPGLRDCGRVRTGQNVLITGASGGVGTFAVQLAKAFGALSILGLIGYPILVAGTIAELFDLHVGLALSIPGALFELGLAFWLLTKGFDPKPCGQVRDHQDRRAASAPATA
jgi:hypothetical protein